MARQRVGAPKAAAAKARNKTPRYDASDAPAPFKPPPDVLRPFVETLDRAHVYVAHVDGQPRAFKRQIFAVPAAMNACVAALLAWRAWVIVPYYARLAASALGYANETTLVAAELAWAELAPAVAGRAASFLLDFVLAVFVWPWPADFCFARAGRGSPLAWRLLAGFRDREVVVRRSRRWRRDLRDVVRDDDARSLLLARVAAATDPALLAEKTGYLLMNAHWDLDWAAMVDAATMVDDKLAAIEAFTTVVLVFHDDYGWLCVDTKLKGRGKVEAGSTAEENERRRQVLAFRDALAAVGKEDLFFRWIEVVQFESSQPGGFTAEKQEKAAREIRDMFDKQGINFDEFWKQSVGADANGTGQPAA
ncbi:hypothetical protein GGS23DRAFT_614415 [Durotheca rogersii]|uniref:uncharacterized protein n=1 Tax=Durotheca rogersii TaxID=419775 RepID=UPI002220F213|nr:uncharacterized protein GGS23DRAFT_614415 [Durotheca rogersii]KAI5859953.1 hypothetical protein GGS23DRAFT_614415 [Durotheca rogersii]